MEEALLFQHKKRRAVSTKPFFGYLYFFSGRGVVILFLEQGGGG